MACYLWLDRYEPEPRRLLVSGLALGRLRGHRGRDRHRRLGGLFVGCTEDASLAVVAPVTEEASKGLFLLLLLWWRRAELDGVLDGIVYAGMVGIGFAFTENILYLAAAYNGTDGAGPGGLGGPHDAVRGALPVQPVRPPAVHGLHRHRRRHRGAQPRSRSVRGAWPRSVGYLLAVLAHGLWNGSTIYGVGGFLGVYVVLMVPAFVGWSPWPSGPGAPSARC